MGASGIVLLILACVQAAALSVLMIIFAAVAAGGWFARDKSGLDSPALPEDLLGLPKLGLATSFPTMSSAFNL